MLAAGVPETFGPSNNTATVVGNVVAIGFGDGSGCVQSAADDVVGTGVARQFFANAGTGWWCVMPAGSSGFSRFQVFGS